MNVTKTLLSGTLALTLLVSTAGCDGFLDVNTDPDAATAVPGALLFPTVLANIGSTRAVELGPTASFWSQQYASNGIIGIFLGAERYNVSPNLRNNYWFTNYANGLKNLDLLVTQSEAATPARPNDAAQAKLLSAFIYYQLTVAFGDIPFSQALQPVEFPNPQFDNQRDVLLGIIALADEGIAQIDKSVTNRITRGDAVYEGDLDQWIKFGNSLKLQANMLLRGGGENRDAQIDALIADPNLIRSNADNAIVPFNDQTANPTGRLLELYAGSTENFYVGGAALVDVMNATDDPRRKAFFTLRYNEDDDGATDDDPSTPTPSVAQRCPNVASGTYVGTRAGTGTPSPAGTSRFCNAAYVSRNFFRNDTPERLQTADQILLLEAEYLAAKGRVSEADAKYRAGIAANFDYVTSLGTPSGSFSAAEREAYFANLAPLTAGDAYARVVEQEYIATFGRGIDGWTLIRRTGEVGRINLRLPVNAAQGGTNLIARVPYPQSEVDSNTSAPTLPVFTDPMFFMASSAGIGVNP